MTRKIPSVVAIALVAGTAIGASAQNSAEISGTVTTTGVPPTSLARVLVTISGDTLKPGRTTITDDQGRFKFGQLPTGTFSIVAARAPYVRTAFGARRPGRPGTPISLAAGQRLAGVTIALAHGAAITGLIRDPAGSPAPGIRVEAIPIALQQAPHPAGLTDDRGIYRIFGLPPGQYIVTTNVNEGGSNLIMQRSDEEMDELLGRLKRRRPGQSTADVSSVGGRTDGVAGGAGSNIRAATYGFAPIHYPGTPDRDLAEPVVLAEGEDRGGVNFALQLVPTVLVEGRVSGASPEGTQITLTRQSVRGAASTSLSPIATRPDQSGAFRVTGVSQGKYRIVARAPGSLWALADVSVAAEDVSGIELTLQPGLRLSGRIAFDGHAPPPASTTIRLRLVDVHGATTFLPTASGRADGTFEFSGLPPGTYTMTSASGDTPWWLRSVVVDGRDVLDAPLELGPNGDVAGAVATFTDRHTEMTGTLTSAAQVPAPEFFVVVFPAERAFWRPASRRVQFTRPNTDGRFSFRDLPAGGYLIAALTDMEATDLFDDSFLERLAAAALPVQIKEGETTTQDLRIAR